MQVKESRNAGGPRRIRSTADARHAALALEFVKRGQVSGPPRASATRPAKLYLRGGRRDSTARAIVKLYKRS